MTSVQIDQITAASEIDSGLRDALVACWVEVTNAGGAVGFPHPPVDAAQVAPAADDLIAHLDPDWTRLFVALDAGGLTGWVALVRPRNPLVAHWAEVQRLMTAPHARRRGVARALLDRLAATARDDMGLEQLRLAVRGGIGLEAFYERLGWTVIGVHPGALRIAPGNDRDEVTMLRGLRSGAGEGCPR